MILCMNCGKLESYKIRQIITNEIIYSDSGLPSATRVISTKDGESRCPKCGRCVKFFKDGDELRKPKYEKRESIDATTRAIQGRE